MSHPLFENPALKKEICEIGKRVYELGFVSATEGNISCRVGANEVLCTPTGVCKGRMTPEDLCLVDLAGNQLDGTRRRTSEILLHLEVYKHAPEVKSVIHTHPPHATAFAMTRTPLPRGVAPELELYLGDVPLAPYKIPGSREFAETVIPYVKSSRVIVLSNHGTVSYGGSLEQALWWTEILDHHCRTVLLSRALGPLAALTTEEVEALHELRRRAFS